MASSSSIIRRLIIQSNAFKSLNVSCKGSSRVFSSFNTTTNGPPHGGHNGIKEPSFVVQFETDREEVSRDDVKFHTLTDKTKVDMYSLHIQDPDKWTYQTIADKFGMSKARAKAVLYLMGLRDAKQKELLGDAYGVASASSSSGSSSSGSSSSMSIQEWVNVFARFNEAKAEDAAAAATDSADSAATDSADSADGADAEASTDADAKIDKEIDAGQEAPIEKVEKAKVNAVAALLDELRNSGKVPNNFTRADLEKKLVAVDEHLVRSTHVASNEANLGRIMSRVSESGFSTDFKEIGGAKGKTLEDSYYPELFGDRDRPAALARLKKRIEAETRASVEDDYDMSRLLSPSEDNTMSEDGELKEFLGPKPPLVPTPVQALLNSNTTPAGASGGRVARWKFAFKDLSKKDPNSPTMIRTRGGGWRQANALEEMSRSWTKGGAPKNIDIAYHQALAQSYSDVDGDEALAQAFVLQKYERRKQMLQDLTAAKEK